MISLAMTLTRCERGGRGVRLRGVLMRVLMLLVLAGLVAGSLHVVGHIHRACLRMRMEVMEVAR